MDQVNEGITRRALERDEHKEYTLLVDPTIIEADKRDAQMIYLGCRGYRPVVATLKELGVPLCLTRLTSYPASDYHSALRSPG